MSGQELAGPQPEDVLKRPEPGLILKEGDLLPDVGVYTEGGEEFRTARLRGHHTVLVFGCLT